MPCSFARRIKTLVVSRTWLTLPGAEPISSLYIVWIESMITISGCCLKIVSTTISRSVSLSKSISFSNVPIRSARILICFTDSSPETYSTFLEAVESSRHICNKSVDFPIPGSPPTKTREPVTIPPPNTLSSSPIPVNTLSSFSTLTSDKREGSFFSAA